MTRIAIVEFRGGPVDGARWCISNEVGVWYVDILREFPCVTKHAEDKVVLLNIHKVRYCRSRENPRVFIYEG